MDSLYKLDRIGESVDLLIAQLQSVKIERDNLQKIIEGSLNLSGGDNSDWGIDHSAGRPILTYKKCSVIEAETAYWLLALIKNNSVAD